jgi:hypothetical protein
MVNLMTLETFLTKKKKEWYDDYTGRLLALLLALSSSKVTAKGFLNDTRIVIVSTLSHLFQQEQLYWDE